LIFRAILSAEEAALRPQGNDDKLKSAERASFERVQIRAVWNGSIKSNPLPYMTERTSILSSP